MNNTKVPMGAPTKYRNQIPDELIEFFGELKPLMLAGEQVGFIYPTIEKFCSKIGIVTSTFYKWCDEKPDLSSAFKIAKQNQKDIIIQLGINGIYKEGFAKFVAINCTDMRDKIETKHDVDDKVVELAYSLKVNSDLQK